MQLRTEFCAILFIAHDLRALLFEAATFGDNNIIYSELHYRSSKFDLLIRISHQRVIHSDSNTINYSELYFQKLYLVR